jgi:hypothetical protein
VKRLCGKRSRSGLVCDRNADHPLGPDDAHHAVGVNRYSMVGEPIDVYWWVSPDDPVIEETNPLD